MSEALATLGQYLSYPFVQYALIVGVLIALCSSLLGTTLVMKRLSYIGDGLSHVAFGAYAVAAIAGISNSLVLTTPVTIVTAVYLMGRSNKAKVHGDAAIAMLSVASLAAGYLLMNVFSTSSNVSGDVCTTLFGSTSILTLTTGDVWLCVALSILVVSAFVLLYNRIFSVTFDVGFSQATGVSVKRYNLILAVMVALVIVLGMSLVGALLLSALVVFPCMAAMRVCHTFRSVTLCSAIISVVAALVGMLVSILFSTPVGATIVMFDAVAFVVLSIVGSLRGGAEA
ncbi:MAG: metal ABC transporter permease [Coriobacteriales bacterium]|nr:metal ABC transporter permease [Coriobacteriales bacterium]